MANLFSSFSILNTAALIGLLSLLIPLIIHLINRSKGKLVYLGNIEFVKQVKRIRVTEVKLTQWLLLLLRILILTLITILVAGLSHQSSVKTLDETRLYFSPKWILSQEKINFNEIIQKNSDAKAFVLTADFPELNLENFDQYKQQLRLKNYHLHSTAWLAEIATSEQRAKQTKIYTTNSSSEFAIQRPQLAKVIEWNFSAVSGELDPIPEITVNIYSDKTRTVETQLLQIIFEHINATGNDLFKVNYHSSNMDSKFSSASLHPEWIFWVSDDPVSENIWERVNQGAFLLTDYSSRDTSNPTQTKKTLSYAKVDGVGAEFVSFNRLIDLNDETHTVIWADNLDAELLSSRSIGNGLHYSFNSRFNPAWNNLVENPKFPMVLSNLLSASAIDFENKKIDISELKNLPRVVASTQISEDFHNWLILIIALLWTIERWLSEKRGRANG